MDGSQNNDEAVTMEPLPECSACYWADICMLTTFMRNLCVGPFKDKETHMKFWEDHIKGKKLG